MGSLKSRSCLLAFLAAVLPALAVRAQVQPVGGFIAGLPYHVSGLLADPIRPRVYAAEYGTGQLIVIDTTTLKTVATVLVGPEPVDLAISPDGKTLYVANFGSAASAISVVDLDALTVRATLALTRRIAGIAAGLDGRVYASGTSSKGSIVYQLDGTTGEVQHTFGSNPDTTSRLGITPDGKTLFFAAGNAKSDVQSFDVSTATPTVRQTVSQVQASSGQLVVSHTGKYVVLPYTSGEPAMPFGETDVYAATDITHLDTALIGDDYGGVLAFNADDSLIYQIREGRAPVLAIFDTATFQSAGGSRSAIPSFSTADAEEFVGDSYGAMAIDHTGSYVFVSDMLAGYNIPTQSRLLVLATGVGTMKPAVPTVTFASFAVHHAGDSGVDTLRVFRVGDLTKKLVVHYTTTDSAQSGVDFQPLSGTVKFKLGQDTATITVVPLKKTTAAPIPRIKFHLPPSTNYRRGEFHRVNLDLD